MSPPIKLLIIDDNEEILISLNRYLTKKQYDVVSVNNGLDALKILEASADSFDLVVTDLVMPNISGVAVTVIIKKRYPRIPVIAITGYGEQPESLAREAKADVVMEKPFKLNILGDNIQDLLKKN